MSYICTENSFDCSLNLHTDFVMWRGLLSKLLITPYENRDGWMISVILYHGTWYMCAFETEEQTQDKLNETEKQKEMSYWGYKFEQYMVKGKDHL